jgi:hypothetical protein
VFTNEDKQVYSLPQGETVAGLAGEGIVWDVAFEGVSEPFQVVTELPATIPPNTLVLFEGELWRGILAGESTLAVGTPIPAKGYWDCHISIVQDGNNVPTIATVFKAEILPTISIDGNICKLDFPSGYIAKTLFIDNQIFARYETEEVPDLAFIGVDKIANNSIGIVFYKDDIFTTIPISDLTDIFGSFSVPLIRVYPPLPE